MHKGKRKRLIKLMESLNRTVGDFSDWAHPTFLDEFSDYKDIMKELGE